MRRLLLVLFSSFALQAQTLSVAQLRSFIQSSKELKMPDKQVSDYLKKAKLTQRLEPGVYEELMAIGVGPKTAELLRDMMAASKTLTAPISAVPKPPPPPIPPPSAEEQGKIIEEAREYAMNYSKRLPDFICTQVTRRYIDPTGLEFWRMVDTVNTRLSDFEQKEDYKVITINGQMTTVNYDDLGGSTSSGEFGTMMKQIFDRDTQTRFQWERWGTLRGRRMHVFSYFVAQPNSQRRINWQRKQEIITGYRGNIFLDKENNKVIRITLESDIPPTFPVQSATEILDYEYQDIGGQQYLLPMKAEVRMRETKYLSRNDVEFRLYRKFGSDTKITFDTPDPLPESATKEEPAPKKP